MPKEKDEQLCVTNIRYSEYYGMQETFDRLYAESKDGKIFTDLMKIILSDENIMLAYRTIKSNSGSKTAGTDGLTIKHIARMTSEEVTAKVRYILTGIRHGYRPKPVRRKEIPKPNGKTRPLGIPCIWDRFVQQCIKQVLEPVCEAKFSHASYGFRPNRSAEHILRRVYNLMQLSHLYYVIEFDIKGFFDNVNHSKLIKQLWAMGIRDKTLLYIIRKILKAPIKMPDGTVVNPQKGTPQGGIISPLLANVVLNELDKWIESQWTKHPVTFNYKPKMRNGIEYRSKAYRAMRKTNLKEMYIVRYADDFRIFCRTKSAAERTKIAVMQWLEERLKLEISPEKTRVVNVKRRYSEFLGFKIKVVSKSNSWRVASHICDKQMKRQREKLVKQARRIARPSKGKTAYEEVTLYNSMVMGMQSYYRTATCICLDCNHLNRAVMTVFTNRLVNYRNTRLKKSGRKLSPTEKQWYGKSAMLRYDAATDEPIYPVGYVRYKNPMALSTRVCSYTAEGREGLHDNLKINVLLMLRLMRQRLRNRSIAFADNRISLFSAQWGRCAITGKEFTRLNEIHCHHKLPKAKGGTDKFSNLILVCQPVHRLIHATDGALIETLKSLLQLDKQQFKKLNKLRTEAGLQEIE